MCQYRSKTPQECRSKNPDLGLSPAPPVGRWRRRRDRYWMAPGPPPRKLGIVVLMEVAMIHDLRAGDGHSRHRPVHGARPQDRAQVSRLGAAGSPDGPRQPRSTWPTSRPSSTTSRATTAPSPVPAGRSTPRPRARSSGRSATSARASSWPAASATSTTSTASSRPGVRRSPTPAPTPTPAASSTRRSPSNART